MTTADPDPTRIPREAYEDLSFLRSADARLIRVAAELLEPQFRLEREGIEDTIVFFGSARVRPAGDAATNAGLNALAESYEAARELAGRLTSWSNNRPGTRQFVVCSGGGPGIMEAANRGATEAGGKSIGLGITIPEEESINEWVTPDLAFAFHYFFLRKFWFLYNAKALVFFPGGFGTMDELMEALTLIQTKRVRKPMGIILYDSNFWRSVLDLDALVQHGVISPEDRGLLSFSETVDDAFETIVAHLEENYGPSLLLDD